MLYFSRRKVTTHRFNINEYKGDTGIGYVMITGKQLMAKIGLIADFMHNYLEWYGATLTTKYPGLRK